MDIPFWHLNSLSRISFSYDYEDDVFIIVPMQDWREQEENGIAIAAENADVVLAMLTAAIKELFQQRRVLRQAKRRGISREGIIRRYEALYTADMTALQMQEAMSEKKE